VADDSFTDPPDAESEPLTAEHIGKYIVLDTLGQGAMGLVLRAYDPTLDRAVALKLVHPARGAAREGLAKARLVAEARALARVSHPNVVSVFAVGVIDERVFVAMELVPGIDLARWLRAQPRPWKQVVDVFVAAARGLSAVHAAGIVHRDVKPANILVGDDGRVRIGDFGIARADDGFSSSPAGVESEHSDALVPVEGPLTAEGLTVGTPAYMAPEQHDGADVGPAADQYALCVALYEGLYGRRPFDVNTRRLRNAKRTPPSAPPRDRDVPRWLFAVVVRGLQPDPRARHPDVDALADALQRDPARRRRAIAGVAIGVLALAGFASWTLTRPGPCDDVGTRLVGAWDAPTQERVMAAFSASSRPYAEAMADRVGRRLDSYAEAWTATAHEACLATRVRGEQSDAMLDRRMACLDGRRHQLAAVTQLMIGGGDDVVDRAMDLVATVEPVSGCDDLAALAAGLTPNDDLARRSAVDAAREQLARADAALSAGRIAEALALSGEVGTIADDIGYEPLQAEVLLVRGSAHDLAGSMPEARRDLERGLWLAVGSGHERIAARIAAKLVWHLGEREQDLAGAERLAELGRVLVRRAGDDPTAAAALHDATGAALSNEARWDEAIAEHEAAIRVAESSGNELQAIKARYNIGTTLFARGDLSKAHDVFAQVVDAFGEEVGRDHPDTLNARASLAATLPGDAEGIAQAEAVEREIVARYREIYGPDSIKLAGALTNLAATVGRQGRQQDALALYREALPIYERAGHNARLALVLQNMGSMYLDLRIYDAAEQALGRSVATREAIYGATHPQLVLPLVGLSRIHVAQQRWQDAQAFLERAREITDAHLANTRAVGVVRSVMADVARGRGELERAHQLYAEALAAFRRADDRAQFDIALTYEDSAEVLLALHRPDEALRAAEAGIAELGTDEVRGSEVSEHLARIVTAAKQAMGAKGRRAQGPRGRLGDRTTRSGG
jgi:tetratricopeptide (TPR) repeat protein